MLQNKGASQEMPLFPSLFLLQVGPVRMWYGTTCWRRIRLTPGMSTWWRTILICSQRWGQFSWTGSWRYVKYLSDQYNASFVVPPKHTFGKKKYEIMRCNDWWYLVSLKESNPSFGLITFNSDHPHLLSPFYILVLLIQNIPIVILLLLQILSSWD